MSPAKIAMEVAATIAPIAGTGSRKKVTGTRSAVPMVAVRPGDGPDRQAIDRGGQHDQHHVEAQHEVERIHQ